MAVTMAGTCVCGSTSATFDCFGLQTRWPLTLCTVNSSCLFSYKFRIQKFNEKTSEMGLSQSSEVSEGGTYGYHVHGVSVYKCVHTCECRRRAAGVEA